MHISCCVCPPSVTWLLTQNVIWVSGELSCLHVVLQILHLDQSTTLGEPRIRAKVVFKHIEHQHKKYCQLQSLSPEISTSISPVSATDSTSTFYLFLSASLFGFVILQCN